MVIVNRMIFVGMRALHIPGGVYQLILIECYGLQFTKSHLTYLIELSPAQQEAN